MSYNALQNGDFSNGFASWTLAGAPDSAQVVEEPGCVFARLGPGVQLKQDVNIEPGPCATIVTLRASSEGKGVTVLILALDDGGQEVQNLGGYTIVLAPAPNWTQQTRWVSNPGDKVRLVFLVDSAVEILDVQLRSA
jgi:hypothetical protein